MRPMVLRAALQIVASPGTTHFLRSERQLVLGETGLYLSSRLREFADRDSHHLKEEEPQSCRKSTLRRRTAPACPY